MWPSSWLVASQMYCKQRAVKRAEGVQVMLHQAVPGVLCLQLYRAPAGSPAQAEAAALLRRAVPHLGEVGPQVLSKNEGRLQQYIWGQPGRAEAASSRVQVANLMSRAVAAGRARLG